MRRTALYTPRNTKFKTPEGTPGYDRYEAAYRAQELSDCENGAFNVSAYPSLVETSHTVGAFVYDCVVSFAAAMSQATDPSDGDEVSRAFKQLRFDGASGPVAYDVNTGDREGSSVTFALYSWQEGEGAVDSVRVGVVTDELNIDMSWCR